MTTVSLPPMELTLPDEWKANQIVVMPPREPSGFTPNVILSCEPIGEQTNHEQFAKRNLEMLSSASANLTVIRIGFLDTQELPLYATEVSMIPAGSKEALRQAQLYALIGEMWYVTTISVAEADSARLSVLLQLIVASFTLKFDD